MGNVNYYLAGPLYRFQATYLSRHTYHSCIYIFTTRRTVKILLLPLRVAPSYSFEVMQAQRRTYPLHALFAELLMHTSIHIYGTYNIRFKLAEAISRTKSPSEFSGEIIYRWLFHRSAMHPLSVVFIRRASLMSGEDLLNFANLQNNH